MRHPSDAETVPLPAHDCSPRTRRAGLHSQAEQCDPGGSNIHIAAASYEAGIPSELLDDDGVFYPSNDAEQMWLLSEQVRELVTQKLEPNQAERLLPELDRLFRDWSIYPPGSCA